MFAFLFTAWHRICIELIRDDLLEGMLLDNFSQ